jgi:hypothetical protein
LSRTASIVKWTAGLLVGAVVAVFLVDLIEGPFFSLSTRTWPPAVDGDRVIGGIEGAVKATDRVTGTMLVASGFLGLSSLPVIVTPQTEVAVKGKLGGVADLGRGQFVRVLYEVQPDRLLAQRIDVLDGVGSSSLTPPLELDRKASAEEPRLVTETVSTETPSPAVELPPRVVTPAAPAPLPATRPTAAAPVSAPKRLAPPPPVASAPRPAPPAPVVSAPRPAPPPAAAPRPAAARSADDGTDAVDWLLKGVPAR